VQYCSRFSLPFSRAPTTIRRRSGQPCGQRSGAERATASGHTLIPFLHKVAFALASTQRLRVGSRCQGQTTTFSSYGYAHVRHLGDLARTALSHTGTHTQAGRHARRQTRAHARMQAGMQARTQARTHASAQARRHARVRARMRSAVEEQRVANHVLKLGLATQCQHARLQGWPRGAIYVRQARLCCLVWRLV
jgi:hypothetical protein